MARLIIAIVILGSSISAFAGVGKTILECSRNPGGGDEGYEVSIVSRNNHIGATLSVIDPSGKRTVGRYAVKFIPADPRRPGSSAAYRGKEFLLQLHTNGRPRQDHLIPSFLSAVSQEDRFQVQESLLCE